MDHQKLTQQLVGARRERSSALNYLYSSQFPRIRDYVCSNSGSEEQALDVFQDAVIILIKNIASGKFKGESSVNTYLYAIGKNLWLKQLRKEGKMRPIIEADAKLFSEGIPILESETLRMAVSSALADLGETCREILQMFYFYKRSMSEIATATGFKNDQSVRNKKVKCLKALKQLIADDQRLSEILHPDGYDRGENGTKE